MLVALAVIWPVSVVAGFDALALMGAVAGVLVGVAVIESLRPDAAAGS